jgi:dCMP deaminase
MSERENWDTYFMGFATKAASRATCPRGSVGCVFVRNRDIIATGYNGSVSGTEHCDEVATEEHVVHGHCDIVLHAEINAIIRAARTGVILLGSEVYITHRPCWPCTKALLNVGVTRIIFLKNYRSKDPAAKKVEKYCAKKNVSLVCLSPTEESA